MLQLGYAIDDLQYGFSAIVNNIPQIAMGLGAGAGVAGVAAIAAVAISQLVKHAGDLADIFSSWNGGRPVEVLKQIREEAEAATEAFEKLSKFTEKEEANAGKVGKFVQNQPKDKFVAEVMDAFGVDEKRVAALKKYYEAKGNIGRIKGLEGKDAYDARMLQADLDARTAEEDFRRGRAEALVGKVLRPGAEGQKALSDLQSILPHRKEQLADLAHGVDPAERGQKDRAADAAAKAAHDKDEAATRKRIEEDVAAKKDVQRKLDLEKEAQNRLEIQGRANAKKSDKDTAIKSLEDERTRIQKAQQAFDERMWQQQHAGQAQIMQGGGAKNLSDMYLKGALGNSPEALAKQAHEQRNKTNKLLQAIDDKLKEERKVIIKN